MFSPIGKIFGASIAALHLLLSSTLFPSLVLLSSPVKGDSIVINDWNVSLYLQSDGNATARAFLGETVTWIETSNATSTTPGEGVVLEFQDEDAYYACNITNATTTVVANSTFETWPDDLDWRNTSLGAKYFSSDTEEGCKNGERIKIVVAPKQFISDNKNVCSGGVLLQEVDPFKGGKGRCLTQCVQTKDCFGFQWTKQNKIRTCTLYSNYPIAAGGKQGFQQVFCAAVKGDNTIIEDNDED